MRVARIQLKQSAREQNPLKTRRAVDIVRENIPEEIRTLHPETSTSSMGRVYRGNVAKSRAVAGDDVLDAPNVNDIVIPNRLDNFLFIDHILNNSRMLVFISPFAQNLLQTQGTNAAIDGTFKVFLLSLISKLKYI